MSLRGTDISCYDQELADYIDREFSEAETDTPWTPRASVPVWKDFLGH